MTGLEILGAVLIVGLLSSFVGQGDSQHATKTEFSFIHLEQEQANTKDIDEITEPDLVESLQKPTNPTP